MRSHHPRSNSRKAGDSAPRCSARAPRDLGRHAGADPRSSDAWRACRR